MSDEVCNCVSVIKNEKQNVVSLWYAKIVSSKSKSFLLVSIHPPTLSVMRYLDEQHERLFEKEVQYIATSWQREDYQVTKETRIIDQAVHTDHQATQQSFTHFDRQVDLSSIFSKKKAGDYTDAQTSSPPLPRPS